MKRNQLTDKHYGKGSKGFYAALGISAVMVGSACLFAHKQGESLSRTELSEKPEVTQVTTVSRRVTTDIRRTTTAPARKTVAEAAVKLKEETVPAAEISVDAPFSENGFAEQSQTVSADLSGACSPLSDMSTVLNGFSGGELVKNETTGTWQTHNGSDIAAETGSEVYAVSDGEVKEIKKDPLWGVTVTIDHNNGYVTKYCGLSSDLAVTEGVKLSGGSVIGAVGDTADIESSTASHLHIEITHNGKYIDPMTVLGK